MRKIILSLAVIFLSFNLQAYGAVSEFKKKNPDGNKYEFARSYIPALSYFNSINERWSKNPPKKKFPKDDVKVIRSTIEYLVLDNADLRVAKNYMVRYLGSNNSLIRKVADMIIVVCDHDIALNNQEKELWGDWLKKKVSGKATEAQEKQFIKEQGDVEYKRKESGKSLIKATSLLTTVLLSQDNADEKGRLLAITAKQRDKLLDDLDVYGKETTDWGVKAGQNTLQACVAIIREVLEDSAYTVHK